MGIKIEIMGKIIGLGNEKGGVGKRRRRIKVGGCVGRVEKKVVVVEGEGEGNGW